MHKEIEEYIRQERKNAFLKYKKFLKKYIVFIVIAIIFFVYAGYVQHLNNRFIARLSYHPGWERYEGEYENCWLKVSHIFSLNPKSEIFAEVRMSNVYYERIDTVVSVYLWVYQHHFDEFEYRLGYDGPHEMRKEGNMYISETSTGGLMYVDSNMNFIEKGEYAIEHQEEYKQFIIDNEDAIRKLLDVANEYWDLELQYNPD